MMKEEKTREEKLSENDNDNWKTICSVTNEWHNERERERSSSDSNNENDLSSYFFYWLKRQQAKKLS